MAELTPADDEVFFLRKEKFVCVACVVCACFFLCVLFTFLHNLLVISCRLLCLYYSIREILNI